MANFDVKVFATTPAGRVSSVPWLDQPTDTAASRTNARGDLPHRYTKIDGSGLAAIVVDLRAIVNATVGPPDSTLGGHLFSWWVAEYPKPAAQPTITTFAGQSSRIQLNFLVKSVNLGHYLIACRRDAGGTIAVPFDLEVV